MLRTMLRLWNITGGKPKLLLVRIGTQWVWHGGVRDSLWNVSFAHQLRRQALVESWAHRTLQAASIDMAFPQPLIVVLLSF